MNYDLNELDHNGYNLMHYAALYRRHENMKVLEERGASIYVKTTTGHSVDDLLNIKESNGDNTIREALKDLELRKRTEDYLMRTSEYKSNLSVYPEPEEFQSYPVRDFAWLDWVLTGMQVFFYVCIFAMAVKIF